MFPEPLLFFSPKAISYEAGVQKDVAYSSKKCLTVFKRHCQLCHVHRLNVSGQLAWWWVGGWVGGWVVGVVMLESHFSLSLRQAKQKSSWIFGNPWEPFLTNSSLKSDMQGPL